jgi:hypothetical protein
MSRSGYPNVHARLHLTQHTPGDPVRDNEIEVWLHGSRFRVRELSGRAFPEILADMNDPRQLGALPRTVEDMMDRESVERARKARPRPPTELYGDLATNQGWVYAPGRARAEVPATGLAPVAEQILARGKEVGLQRGTSATRLGRTGAEYRGSVTVPADGKHYQNAVTRVIAPPYLLLDDTRSAANPELSYVREIVALDEGTVTDTDVTPPAP